MYEILRLQVTNRSDKEQYQVYRLAVKNRLNGPYQVRLDVLIDITVSFINSCSEGANTLLYVH